MDNLQLRSTLEIKIQKFVSQYGAEVLISYLEDFNNIVTNKDYEKYHQLEKVACESCGITTADMRKFTTTPCTNAKRIISFIAHHVIKFPIPTISKLLGNMAQRSINYYIKDVENWLNQPKGNKEFVEIYTRVSEKLNFE
jgi:hypothetical protein